MGVKKNRSLRQAINAHCRSCIYDVKAAGTWRQQVTLCTVLNCALYPHRPVTKAPIPGAVLDYYRVEGPEREFYELSRPPEGTVSEHNELEECPSDWSPNSPSEKGPIWGGER